MERAYREARDQYDLDVAFFIVSRDKLVNASESKKEHLFAVNQQIKAHIGVQIKVCTQTERKNKGDTPVQIRTGVAGSKERRLKPIQFPIQTQTMDAHSFTKGEMDEFINEISRGKDKTTIDTNRRHARDVIWANTEGRITKETTSGLINHVLTRCKSDSEQRKALGLTKRFYNHLNDTKEDGSLTKYLKQLDLIKVKKPRRLNTRITVDQDVENLINHIGQGTYRTANAKSHTTLVLFLAYTGMRPATANRLKVKNFRDALNRSPSPCIFVDYEIDKKWTEHWVPLHPTLIPLLKETIEGKADSDSVFDHISLQIYLKNHPLPTVTNPSMKVEVKDLRKFMIQKSTLLGLNDDIRDFIVCNEISGIQWEHYKNFTSEQIYQQYLSVWKSVNLFAGPSTDDTEERPLTQAEILEKEIAEKRMMLDAIKAEPEENIQAEQDRYDRYEKEQSIKDDEVHSLILESIRLEEEIENAKSEKGILW